MRSTGRPRPDPVRRRGHEATLGDRACAALVFFVLSTTSATSASDGGGLVRPGRVRDVADFTEPIAAGGESPPGSGGRHFGGAELPFDPSSSNRPVRNEAQPTAGSQAGPIAPPRRRKTPPSGRRLLPTDHIALPNTLLQRRAFPELVQGELGTSPMAEPAAHATVTYSVPPR